MHNAIILNGYKGNRLLHLWPDNYHHLKEITNLNRVKEKRSILSEVSSSLVSYKREGMTQCFLRSYSETLLTTSMTSHSNGKLSLAV
jgi:hypothetical protein